MISGITSGFRLGFDPSAMPLKSAAQNMPSALLQTSVIDQYLLNELQKGRIAGPYSIYPLPSHHVSRFGVIPKKYQLESGGLSWIYLSCWATESTTAFLRSLSLCST